MVNERKSLASDRGYRVKSLAVAWIRKNRPDVWDAIQRDAESRFPRIRRQHHFEDELQFVDKQLEAQRKEKSNATQNRPQHDTKP